MHTIEQLQVNFGMSFEGALDNVVFVRRFLIRHKLACSAKDVESSIWMPTSLIVVLHSATTIAMMEKILTHSSIVMNVQV